MIAIDLPGHGFSGPAPRDGSTPPGMAGGVRALLAAVSATPGWLVGHSAGAASAVRMALDGADGLRGLVSQNGALLPMNGLAGQVFSPLVPRFCAWRAADPVAMRRLIASTGSTLDAAGEALSRRLVSDPRHVAGALRMMARWDLHTLQDTLPRLAVPLHQIVGERDRTVRPANARRVQQMLAPAAAGTSTTLAGLGHLAYEERPRETAQLLLRLLAAASRRRVAHALMRGGRIVSWYDNPQATLPPSARQTLMLRGGCRLSQPVPDGRHHQRGGPMRSWFAVLLALALDACATGEVKMDGGTMKKVPGQVAEGTFHCSGPSGPQQFAKCDDVPIVVLLKADGACLVVVPYAELFVHGGSGGPTVTWNLHAPKDYKFVAGGVRLSKRAGGPDPRTVYEDGKPVANGRAFQWKLKADRKAATFDHDVTVLDKNDQPCDKVDPLIHND